MKNITIRNLLDKDLESLSELYSQFWNEESSIEKMRIKFMELKNNPKYIFLCAIIDDKLAGSVMGIICDELYGDCRPFLLMDDMVVDKKYRKNGIGKILLSELEIECKKKNCSQIIFVTETERKDAVSFYESCGYNSKTHTGFKKSLR
jgi:GNAT superfamily N-acetyltransferase